MVTTSISPASTTVSRLYSVGRALLGSLFLISGFLKIGSFAGYSAWIASAELPLPSLLLALTMVIEIGGGLTLITGWNARWGALVLAAIYKRRRRTQHLARRHLLLYRR